MEQLIRVADHCLLDLSSMCSSIQSTKSISASCLAELDDISSVFDVNQFLQSAKGCSSRFPLENCRNLRIFLQHRLDADRLQSAVQMVLDSPAVPGMLQSLHNQHRIAFLSHGFMRRFIGDVLSTEHAVSQCVFYYLLDFELSLEIAWTLSLMTRGNDAQIRCLVDCDIIPSLIRLFALSSSTNTKSLALEGLTNIIGPIRSGHGHCDGDQHLDVVPMMLRLHFLDFMHCEVQKMASNPLHDGLPYFLRQIANSLHTLLEVAVPAPPQWLSLSVIIKMLQTLFRSKDGETLQAVCWSLEVLCGRDDRYHLLRAHLINSGLVDSAASLLDHKLPNIRLSALKVMAQMAAGPQHQKRHLLEIGILDRVIPLLCDMEHDMLRSASCWLVANMVTVDETASCLVDHDAFRLVLDRLLNDDYFVAKEAFVAVERAVRTLAVEQIEAMLFRNVLVAVCSFMTRWVIDRRQMAATLSTLRVLFEADSSRKHVASCIECGGLQFLLEFIASNDTPPDLQRVATGIVRGGYFTRNQIQSVMDDIYRDEGGMH